MLPASTIIITAGGGVRGVTGNHHNRRLEGRGEIAGNEVISDWTYHPSSPPLLAHNDQNHSTCHSQDDDDQDSYTSCCCCCWC